MQEVAKSTAEMYSMSTKSVHHNAVRTVHTKEGQRQSLYVIIIPFNKRHM